MHTRSRFKSGRRCFVQSLVFAQQEETLGRKVRRPGSEHSCWLAGWLWAVPEPSAPGVGGWGRPCGASEPWLSLTQPLGLCTGCSLSWGGRNVGPCSHPAGQVSSFKSCISGHLLHEMLPETKLLPLSQLVKRLITPSSAPHLYLGKSLCWKQLSV